MRFYGILHSSYAGGLLPILHSFPFSHAVFLSIAKKLFNFAFFAIFILTFEIIVMLFSEIFCIKNIVGVKLIDKMDNIGIFMVCRDNARVEYCCSHLNAC